VDLVGEAEPESLSAAATSDAKNSLLHSNNNNNNNNSTQTAASSSNANNKNNAISDGIVHELGLDNFHSVVGGASFTIVLFYDPDELLKQGTTAAEQKQTMLQQLATDFAKMPQPRAFFLRHLVVNFGMINTRRHHELRRHYLRWTGAGQGEAYEQFYDFWDDLDEDWSEVPDTMVNSSTFLALSPDQLPTFPSEWAVLDGSSFNIVNCMDAAERVDPLDYNAVREWFVQQLYDEIHYAMQGVGQPRLPFRNSEQGMRAAIASQNSKERKKRNEYLETQPMSSIDWDAAEQMAQQQRRLQQQQADQDSNNNKFQADDFAIATDPDTGAKLHYQYRMNTRIKGERDAELLEQLANDIDIYLAWADSYENLWDADRRAAEDERTNYGRHLHTMDEQLRDALFSALDEAALLQNDNDNNNVFSLVPHENIPVLLRDYFEDMLFGLGRSRKSLREYLEQHVYGKTPDQVEALPLLQNIRDYMAVRERVGHQEQYSLFLRALCIQFYAILAEFHDNLSRSYVQYLETTHPDNDDELPVSYELRPMDVFNMKDPENAALLSDYDAFQEQYVAQRKPFILSNVEMTTFEFTLDHLVEKCGHIDVTKKIKESMLLGDKSVKGWGGLKKFELPREIMMPSRNTKRDVWDESISLEQFVELTKHFDTIYLHDLGLKTRCSSLLWEQTPYDPPEQQYFRIPAVIGRYDFLQKVPSSGYQDSWPSLFVGRKGSNSKLHIDSGATGFWMYLVSGRKRWIVYDEAERPYLYERIERASFMADVLALNATQDEQERTMIHDYFGATYPLLSRASTGGYEIIQEPGQLVYIPPGSPHAVENLEDIVGISFNQVPKAGVVNHLFSLIHDKRDFASLEVALRYIMSEPERSFSPIESDENDPLYTTFGAYMAQ